MEVAICEDCNLIGVQWGLVGAAAWARWCSNCANRHLRLAGQSQVGVVVEVPSATDTALVMWWSNIVIVAAEKAGRSGPNVKEYVSKGSLTRQFSLLHNVRDVIMLSAKERQDKLQEAIEQETQKDRAAKLALASLRVVLYNA